MCEVCMFFLLCDLSTQCSKTTSNITATTSLKNKGKSGKLKKNYSMQKGKMERSKFDILNLQKEKCECSTPLLNHILL